MYKVFVNQKTIYLTQDISNLKLEVEDILAHPHTKASMVSEYQRFINNPFALKLFLFKPNNPKQLYRDFLSMFITVEAAGGLVVNSTGQFLFIFRYGKWDLPKGKIESYEIKEDAAVREVEEETTIGNLTIVNPLIRTRHLYDEKGHHCLKHTWWYFMRTTDNHLPVPQTEEGITDARWIERDKLKEIMSNTYPSIVEVINSYFQLEEQTLNQ